MLWNMPYMVKTNKAFTSWLLSNKNGMYFPGEHAPLALGLHVLEGCPTGPSSTPATLPVMLHTGRACDSLATLQLLPRRKLTHLLHGPPCCPAGYGPVDQGAFNQYYEKEVRGKPISKVGCPSRPAWCPRHVRRLPIVLHSLSALSPTHLVLNTISPATFEALRPCPQNFNAMVYHSFRPEARIVHLHG